MPSHPLTSRWDHPVPALLIVLVAVVVSVLSVIVIGSGRSAAQLSAAHLSAPVETRASLHSTTRASQEVDVSGPVGIADGDLPDGVTVFNDTYPGIRNLTSALLSALRTAAAQAGHDGVQFYVSSGWRSVKYQQELLDKAIATYGSRAAASTRVAPPTLSSHVAGEAIDIANSDAQAWLSHHGAAYGLCRIYANETWHFELRPDAARDGCPAMYADAAHDPRMQQ